jgi:hypothetical protein
MKGKLNKINGRWFVNYSVVKYKGGIPKQLGSYTKMVEPKMLELMPNDQDYLESLHQPNIGTRVEFTEVLVNPMGREVDPNDLGQNHSGCVWYAKLVEDKKDLGYTTKIGIEVSDEMVKATMIPKEYFGKEEQKQHLIDIMKGDEELGLYDESREIKIEDIFNDEKREKVKRVILQHKVLQGLSLINPAHLEMTSNGHGEFPDGYKLTEKGIQYIIEQLNKE